MRYDRLWPTRTDQWLQWSAMRYARSWPDGCLWGSHRKAALRRSAQYYFPSSAFGKHWEPRLPAMIGHTRDQNHHQ